MRGFALNERLVGTEAGSIIRADVFSRHMISEFLCADAEVRLVQ